MASWMVATPKRAEFFDGGLVGADDVAFDDAELVHGWVMLISMVMLYWFLAFSAASRRGNTRRALPS